jgi:hypothetical protein
LLAFGFLADVLAAEVFLFADVLAGAAGFLLGSRLLTGDRLRLPLPIPRKSLLTQNWSITKHDRPVL